MMFACYLEMAIACSVLFGFFTTWGFASLMSSDMLSLFISWAYQMMPWSLLMVYSLHVVGIRQVSEAAPVKCKPTLQISVPIFNIPQSYGLMGRLAAYPRLSPYILLTVGSGRFCTAS